MLKHDSDLLPEDARMGLFTPVFDNLVAQLSSEILAGRDSPKGGCAAHTTALVFGAIWRHTQKRYHVCFATQSTLARQAGICVRSIRYHIRRLQELGYIEDTTPDLRNRSHYYKITEKGWTLASRAGDEKTHRQKLPPDSSAKVTTEETLQETNLKQVLPVNLIPQKLKAVTPEAVKLFTVLAEEFEAIGKPTPLCFENLAQKRKFEAVEARLNGSTGQAIESAILAIQPLTLRGVIDYTARFIPKPPKEAAADGLSGPLRQTPPGMRKVTVMSEKGPSRVEYRPIDEQRYEALLEEDKSQVYDPRLSDQSRAIGAALKSRARPLKNTDPDRIPSANPFLRTLDKEKELRAVLKTMAGQATYDSLFGLAAFYEDERGKEIVIQCPQHSFENLKSGRFDEQIKRAVELVFDKQRPVKFELRRGVGEL